MSTKSVYDNLYQQNSLVVHAFIIGGGIANFTNVAATFKGIAKALKEFQDLLKEHNVSIFVRRAGPNYQEGLRIMRELGEFLGVLMHVFGPETHMTTIFAMALHKRDIPDVHAHGQVTTANFLLVNKFDSESKALINTLWLINRVLFHISGVHKHKNLLWGQFNVTQVFGQTCLQYYPNKVNFVGASIKDLDMELFSNKESDTPVSIGRGDSRLPVDTIEIFQIYANMRPVECRNMTDPFYLCPDPIWKKGGSWFKPINAGFQYISKIPRLMGFKTSSALKIAGKPAILSSVLSSSTYSALAVSKDSGILDHDSSQIIDIDSQTNYEDNHSSGSSGSVSVYEQQKSNSKDGLTVSTAMNNRKQWICLQNSITECYHLSNNIKKFV